MIEVINDWIKNPKGRYQEGVAIFKACAPTEMSKNFLAYFEAEKGEPKQFDMPFPILVNKVSFIRDLIALNPDQFKDVKLTIVKTPDNSEELELKNKEIEALKAEIEAKEIEIEELEYDAEENKDEISEKEAEIEELELKLEELGAEFQKLKDRRGIQIVHFDNLPPEIRKLYDRVKEITPLMASLHADISVPKLNNMKRKSLVNQLVKLDDERRAAWDVIDDWSEGKKVEFSEGIQPIEYSADKVVKGAQIARRIDRLKENITRSRTVADNAERQTIKQNALNRTASYEAELTELEKLIKTD